MWSTLYQWPSAIYDIFLRASPDNVICTIKIVYIRLFYSKYKQCSKETVAQRAPYGRNGPDRTCYIGKEDDGEVTGSHDMGGMTTQRDPPEGVNHPMAMTA